MALAPGPQGHKLDLAVHLDRHAAGQLGHADGGAGVLTAHGPQSACAKMGAVPSPSPSLEAQNHIGRGRHRCLHRRALHCPTATETPTRTLPATACRPPARRQLTRANSCRSFNPRNARLSGLHNDTHNIPTSTSPPSHASPGQVNYSSQGFCCSDHSGSVVQITLPAPPATPLPRSLPTEVPYTASSTIHIAWIAPGSMSPDLALS